MHFAFRLVAALSLFIGLARTAHADPFLTTFDPPNVTVNTSSPYSFTLAISGFNATTDTVISATLSIILSDDGGSEGIHYDFDLGGYTRDQNNTGNSAQTYSFDFSTLGILSLLSDGQVAISLSASSGSYIFNSASLAGVTAAVPEPTTFALLVGALALGHLVRRGTSRVDGHRHRSAV
jgi:hypothetical protein